MASDQESFTASAERRNACHIYNVAVNGAGFMSHDGGVIAHRRGMRSRASGAACLDGFFLLLLRSTQLSVLGSLPLAAGYSLTFGRATPDRAEARPAGVRRGSRGECFTG